MKLCFILLSICALTFGGKIPKSNNRIVNGREVTIEEFPYQVSVQYGGFHNCGGAVLNENTVLTAAHCVQELINPGALSIRAGTTYMHSSPGQVHRLSQIIQHPKYSTDNNTNIFDYDVAVLKLATPLIFSDKIQPIELQPANSPVPVGTTATVSGWGETMAPRPDDALRAVETDVFSSEECKSRYGKEELEITSRNICTLTPKQGECYGDSGGPLVANGKLIGTVTGGLECAGDYYPSVFSNVSNLREFIDEHL